MRTLEGAFAGQGRRFGVVVSRFNGFVTEGLLKGALDALLRHGVEEGDITVARVPGAFEIPAVARRLADPARCDAVICLGAVIRGGTPHFDHICSAVTRGVSQVALDSPVPVLFGVLTTNTVEEAIERAGTKANKGAEAALAALEMTSLFDRFSSD